MRESMGRFLTMMGIVLAISIIVGCNATGSYTSNEKFSKSIVGPIEKKNFSYQGIYRNPIIIVHGFLGANLVNKKTGENVWGDFIGANGIGFSDERMRNLSLPMKLGVPLKDIKDNVVPAGILDTVTVRIMGISFKEKAYLNLVDILNKGGFQPEGFPMGPGRNCNTLFMFAYDWRRDLQWNAVKLHEFILKKRKYIQKQYQILYGIKNFNVQFDLIGHSMGGLLSRYYLRYGTADLPPEGEKPKITWAGSRYIDRVLILGTPNAGYLDTVLEMVNGKDVPPLPPALLSTWATYYQMMPVPSRRSVVYLDNPEKAVNLFDPNVWIKNKWGLADPTQDDVLKILLPDVKSKSERRKIALDHLQKCLKRAKRFIDAMKVPATPPSDVMLYLVLGNAVKTRRRAFLDSKTGKLVIKDPESYAPGDGKVTVSSAMFDERAGQTWTPFFKSPISWRSIIQLRAAHMGITTDPAFRDNALFLLNAVPTVKLMKSIEEKK